MVVDIQISRIDDEDALSLFDEKDREKLISNIRANNKSGFCCYKLVCISDDGKPDKAIISGYEFPSEDDAYIGAFNKIVSDKLSVSDEVKKKLEKYTTLDSVN